MFEARPQEFLDADRLCQLMLEAQKKAMAMVWTRLPAPLYVASARATTTAAA